MSAPPQSTAETLVRIEVKLDMTLQRIDDHENRLRALESRRIPRPAVNVALTAVASAAAVITVLEPLLNK